MNAQAPVAEGEEATGRRVRGRRSTGGHAAQHDDARMATRRGQQRSTSMPAPKRRKIKCPNDNDHHGKVVGELRVCYACNQGAVEGEDKKPVWKHLPSKDVEDAKEWWPSATKRHDSCVRDGYLPTRECLCGRARCLYQQWQKEKRTREAVRAAGPPRSCAICKTDASTPVWRHPGIFLLQLTRWFKSGQASTQELLYSGDDLTPDSDICHCCYMEGYNHKDSR
ncbi:unnamed protein product [Ectocarpus fasciculatus]